MSIHSKELHVYKERLPIEFSGVIRGSVPSALVLASLTATSGTGAPSGGGGTAAGEEDVCLTAGNALGWRGL